VIGIKGNQDIVELRDFDDLIVGTTYPARSNEAGFWSVVNEGVSF
jgi:hypothetical protein